MATVYYFRFVVVAMPEVGELGVFIFLPSDGIVCRVPVLVTHAL
jgi:hypothetical protein